MTAKKQHRQDLLPVPMLLHESLYVGIDVGKTRHVAGFVSSTLIERHQRFEACPSLALENSREGFRSLIDRIRSYVPLEQVFVLLEYTGHYHRALVEYLQELAIWGSRLVGTETSVAIMHTRSLLLANESV